jgi:hypothetical protein
LPKKCTGNLAFIALGPLSSNKRTGLRCLTEIAALRKSSYHSLKVYISIVKKKSLFDAEKPAIIDPRGSELNLKLSKKFANSFRAFDKEDNKARLTSYFLRFFKEFYQLV